MKDLTLIRFIVTDKYYGYPEPFIPCNLHSLYTPNRPDIQTEVAKGFSTQADDLKEC